MASCAEVASEAPAQPAETIEYYGQDVIGSVRIVFSPNGTVLGRQDYEPFGRPLFTSPALPKEGFGGQETDDESDHAHFHARMFQARTGRFTRVDPVYDGQFDPQRWNRYAYSLNRPLTFTDPSGLSAASGFSCANPAAREELHCWFNDVQIGLDFGWGAGIPVGRGTGHQGRGVDVGAGTATGDTDGGEGTPTQNPKPPPPSATAANAGSDSAKLPYRVGEKFERLAQ